MIKFAVVVTCLILSSCSVATTSSDRSLAEFLRQDKPALYAYIDKSELEARSKTDQAFRYYDASLDALGPSVNRIKWYQSTAKILNILHRVYVNDEQNEHLDRIGSRFIEQVEREAFEQGSAAEKNMIFETLSASRKHFDQIFERELDNDRAKKLLHQFIIGYTPGFLLVDNSDPEREHGMWTTRIPVFRISLYLLFAEELPQLR